MSSNKLAEFGKHVLAARTAKGWTGAQLAHEALGNQDRKGFISQVEQGKRPLSALTIQKFAKALDLDESVVNPLLGLELPTDDAPPETLPNSAKLEDVASLTRAQLIFLAEQFDIEAREHLSEPKLQHLLTQKAEEYRSYRDQIDALDDRIAGVHNLKAAAQDAAERLDFDEVEALLARVDRVETEIMAETKEARATNALLRGRTDQAYAVFTAAAESFRELDILEMARRRNLYFVPLYSHGLRYGGTGLARAIDIQRPGIAALKDTPQSKDWADFTQNLALALQNLGIRTDGKAGTDLLAEAVSAYRDALTVTTRADQPVRWAGTTQNLALALQNQGTRTDGKAGTDLLAQAVSAYRDALTVTTRADQPVRWAGTTQNLALALQNQGTRTDGKAGTVLLAEAVSAYRDALTVFTRADHPVHWAGTIQNLAVALQDQGIRTEGKAGKELLAEAISAYRDALTITTRTDHPMDWAGTTQNLALALQNQGIRTEGKAGANLLAEAIFAYRDALTVFTRTDHPVNWAGTTESLATAELALAELPATEDPIPHLKTALEHVEAALTVYDPDHMSYYYQQAIRLRDVIQARLDAL